MATAGWFLAPDPHAEPNEPSEPAHGADTDTPEPRPDTSPGVWVFETGPRGNQPTFVLLVEPDGAGGALNFTVMNRATYPNWDASPYVALVPAVPYGIFCQSEPCIQPEAPWISTPIGSEANFGVDGYNATRLTVYAFDNQGGLIASNANASEIARFALSPAVTSLYNPGNVTWYFGVHPIPPNMTVPPSLGTARAGLYDQLRGLPVGGIASVYQETDRVFVTVRIDELVRAP